METVSVVGLDLAKNVFQVHALDEKGNVIVRRSLRRSAVLKFFGALPRCLVGMEACASAHHWARELSVMGHDVRLMPPHYVKRGKTDATEAEAVAEAVTPGRAAAVVEKAARGTVSVDPASPIDLASRPPSLNPTLRRLTAPPPSSTFFAPRLSDGPREKRCAPQIVQSA
jgi:hypothetical protein